MRRLSKSAAIGDAGTVGGVRHLLPIGDVLQRPVEDVLKYYELGAELGRGSFGVTRRCTNKDTMEEFACKSLTKHRHTRSLHMIDQEVIETEQDKKDVRKEVQLMDKLQYLDDGYHPNIIRYFEAYEDKKCVHLVLELCTGGELASWLEVRGSYSEKQAANVFRDMLKIVQHCNNNGVMHRDLKPENFLMSDHSDTATLKAIDFGLSREFESGERYSERCGTPAYMAPEVWNEDYGPECDVWTCGVILYQLLSGNLPFNTVEDIIVANYPTNGPIWDQISDSAKDCIKRLLDPNPASRITVEQALGHRWVREGGEASSVPMDSRVLECLKQHTGMNRLKAMALGVVAGNMSEAEIQALKERFRIFDKNGDGKITAAELQAGITAMGKKEVKQEVIEKTFAELDVDGDGEVSYEEFVLLALRQQRYFTEENLRAAFAAFDTDDNGHITRDELENAMLEHGMHVEDIETILKDIDKDQDGRIDYDEFVDMMHSVWTC